MGARRLRRSWGLTLVAGFALTVVIALAAGAFEVLGLLAGTDLPLAEGDRVVVLQAWDPDQGEGLGTAPEDFARWRDHLRSVRGVSAYRLAERNLETTDSGRGGPGLAVEVAEISASAFPLVRVPPALGRPLLPEDEAPAAEPVLVVGHREWQRRFDGDPEILGRRVRLDGRTHTVVGVMPEGFAFPVSQSYWAPLRLGAGGGWVRHLALLGFLVLLVPPAVNVAILVYARTLTRQGEFAARYVLGASRFRIVFQLFLEILVLATGAGLRTLGGQATPARLGAVWTTLIVAQVAISTALLPVSAEMVWGTVRSGMPGPGFAADSYLTARLEAGDPDGTPVAGSSRFARLQDELALRLAGEPGITAVSLAARVPGEEPWMRVTPEGADPDRGAVGSSRVAQVNRVDEAFFDLFELPLLAGRGFEAADFDPARRSVVVNQAFATHVLGDANPVGRRIAYPARPGADEPTVAGVASDTWYEIVGVVGDVHRHAAAQAVYHPARGTTPSTVSLLLRTSTGGDGAAGTLRATTWALDPSLRVADVRALDEIYRQRAVGNWMGAGALLAVVVSLLWLSAAGIYALMSFTVGRRRKEIGIRAALGASPGRLVAAGGLGIALLVDHLLPIEDLGGWEIPGAVPAAAVFLTLVALLALAEPARRGLAVEPVEELRQG